MVWDFSFWNFSFVSKSNWESKPQRLHSLCTSVEFRHCICELFFQTTLFSAMMESHQRLKMCSESEQLFPLTKLSTRHKGKTKSLLLQQIFRAFFSWKKPNSVHFGFGQGTVQECDWFLGYHTCARFSALGLYSPRRNRGDLNTLRWFSLCTSITHRYLLSSKPFPLSSWLKI